MSVRDILSLSAQLGKADDADRQVDLIRALNRVPMTYSLLVETNVGNAVKPLKKSEVEAVANAAKALLKSWKAIADATSSTSSNESSAGASDLSCLSPPPRAPPDAAMSPSSSSLATATKMSEGAAVTVVQERYSTILENLRVRLPVCDVPEVRWSPSTAFLSVTSARKILRAAFCTMHFTSAVRPFLSACHADQDTGTPPCAAV